jgi:hypothetical protein
VKRAAVALKLCLALALFGCAGAKSPSLDLHDPATMRAVLAAGAEGIAAADKTCAQVADSIATHANGDLTTLKRAATLNDGCNKAAHAGRDALLAGEAALDACNDGHQAEVACAAQHGLDALRSLLSSVRGIDPQVVPPVADQAVAALSALLPALAPCSAGN